MSDADDFVSKALGRCDRCGCPDSWHYGEGTNSVFFGLLEISHGAGCGNLNCDCDGFVGESFIIDTENSED